jgi:hypothetical protein
MNNDADEVGPSISCHHCMYKYSKASVTQLRYLKCHALEVNSRCDVLFVGHEGLTAYREI